MKFNEKIIRLRKNMGMTQGEFANAVGVSRQAVYKWEKSQTYPEVSKLLEIKLLFGISIDDLLDDNFEVAEPEKKKRKRTQKPKPEVTEEYDQTSAVAAAEEAEPALILESVTEPISSETPVTVTEEIEKVTAEEIQAATVSQNNITEEAIETPEEEKKAPAATTAEDDSEVQRAEPEKKVGFFGRLFGRK